MDRLIHKLCTDIYFTLLYEIQTAGSTEANPWIIDEDNPPPGNRPFSFTASSRLPLTYPYRYCLSYTWTENVVLLLGVRIWIPVGFAQCLYLVILELKKSLLFFLFKLWTLTGIHFPCLGWITTVFLTFAIKTFFFLMVGLQ